MKNIFFIISCALVSLTLHAAPESELIPFWNASDESNKSHINHDVWQATLDKYLVLHESGINRFDYAALKSTPQDVAKLNTYLNRLQALDPRTYARREQKAYWINFYNALTVKIVTDAYPVDSIKAIHEGWMPRSGPWGDIHAHVLDKPLTLDNIEHGILRPIWQDARIHYAVNCASLGCPNLAPKAYTSANLNTLLEQGARSYVNHVRGVDVVDADFLVISSIYDWFIADFGDSEKAVIEHLIEYASDGLADQLRNFSGAIDYAYDWDLNQP